MKTGLYSAILATVVALSGCGEKSPGSPAPNAGGETVEQQQDRGLEGVVQRPTTGSATRSDRIPSAPWKTTPGEAVVTTGAFRTLSSDEVSAVTRGDIDKVAQLLREDPGAVNARDIQSRTLLHIACSAGETDVVNLLLKSGAQVDATVPGDWTPLHLAAQRYAVPSAMIESLVAAGADINSQDNFGRTPLHLAVEAAAFDTVKVLLANKANVDARDNGGNTPLRSALANLSGTYRHMERMIEMLLAGGADVNAKNNKGETPLDLALWRRPKLVEFLRSRGARTSK